MTLRWFGLLLLFLTMPAAPVATAQPLDCDHVASDEKFHCKHRNWVHKSLQELWEDDRPTTRLVLRRAGCGQHAGPELEKQVQSCEQALEEKFLCRVTTALCDDAHICDNDFKLHCDD
jgi:hypothetical protein